MRDSIRFIWFFQIAGLLFAAALGWQRAALAQANAAVLAQLGLQPGPVYLTVSGAAWCALALAAAAILLARRPWSYRAAFGLSAALALAYWVDRLALTRSPAAAANWPFALFYTALLLFISAGLMILDPRTELRFDRKQRPGNRS